MIVIDPDVLTAQERIGLAESLRRPPERVALRRVRLVGPLAFYWTYGRRPRVWRDRLRAWPRVRWVGGPGHATLNGETDRSKCQRVGHKWILAQPGWSHCMRCAADDRWDSYQ